jgi:oxalate decarboxylase/phosphoglucose isomerase-like protein (cupin superfamily)
MAADLRFVTPDDVETQLFAFGSFKWLSESRVTGASRSTVGVLILDCGKGNARHNHPAADETLYVISGEGDQMVEDDDGNPVVRHVRAGDLVYIPQGVFHSTRNSTWEPLRALVMYSPGGPEAILRARADCTVRPAGELPAR